MMQDDSCVMALYAENSETVTTTYKYNINLFKTEHRITHLHQSTYYLSNISNYQLVCEQGRQLTKSGCQACIITIPPQCEFRQGNVYIPPVYQNTTQNLNGHLVNKILALKFYNLRDLQAISAN